MLKIKITFIFILIVGLCLGQNAYYDAIKISKIKTARSITNKIILEPADSQIAVFNSFFKNYLPDSIKLENTSDSTVYVEIKKMLSKNPFMEIASTALSDDRLKSLKTMSSRSSPLPSVGSLNVTNLADGIARFLIKRGKEELNVAFFERMKTFLDDPKHPECKTLFPSTIEFLTHIETFRYAELIESLREAFNKDLSNLLVNLNQLIDLPKYKALLKGKQEIRAAVRASKIVSELSQSDEGIMPAKLIEELSQIAELQTATSNLGNGFRLLNIISQNVRVDATTLAATDKNRNWIKLSEFNSLVNDPVTLKIFIGLLYQQISNEQIQFGGTMVKKFIEDNVNEIYTISSLVENFVVHANDVDRTIKDIKDKTAKGSLTNDDYYSYISKAINITEYGFKVANTIQEGTIDDNYIMMARNANELYRNIYTKNYGKAVMNTYTILDGIFNKTLSNPNGAPNSEAIENILKYGNFMAAVVKAESGEEVENALEAATLPAGSYSIKQKSSLNFSINGYIGYAWDFEHFAFKDQFAHGVYAPVGLAISHGSKKKCGLTFTGFLSLIDVGGIASYRLQDNSDDALKQDVRLESIFSPSAQLFLELKGLPFAIGGGWRQTPKLFYSNTNSFFVQSPHSVFNFSILVDIPFFNIKNLPFSKK